MMTSSLYQINIAMKIHISYNTYTANINIYIYIYRLYKNVIILGNTKARWLYQVGMYLYIL